jgi:hypothetical protein
MVKVKKHVKGQNDSKRAKIPTPPKGKATPKAKLLKKGQLKKKG